MPVTPDESGLTLAHCKFLEQIGKIQETESNSFFKGSKYANLQGVLSVVNPVLADNGLSVHQVFDHTPEGRTILKTLLRHVSGEQLISSVLFPETSGKNPLHDFGGNTTYIRRYSLLAILGICAGIEDTDGNHAEPPRQEREWRANTSDSNNTLTQTDQKLPALAEEADLVKCRSRLSSLYMTDKKLAGEFEAAYCVNFNFPPTVHHRISHHMQERIHTDFVLDWFDKHPEAIK